jgi:hypothetical protein
MDTWLYYTDGTILAEPTATSLAMISTNSGASPRALCMCGTKTGFNIKPNNNLALFA